MKDEGIIRNKLKIKSAIRNAKVFIDIRKEFGVSILSIFRNNKMINTISPDERLIQNDIVYIRGDLEHIERFYNAVT